MDNSTQAPSAYRYTVGTLMTDPAEYAGMRQSFIRAGFTEDICQYLVADNSRGNQWDAFSGLNHLLNQAQGKYILLVHQDVELNHDREPDLAERLKEMEDLNPRWGVLGNAGFRDVKRAVKRIAHRHEILTIGPFPQPVSTLDENFLVLKGSAGLRFSAALTGFHMYGPDICLQAESKGYSCYVIDFLLLHKSTGNVNQSFYRSRGAFIRHHSPGSRSRYLRTTISVLFLSNNPILCRLMNQPWMISLAKFFKKAELKIKGLPY